MTGRRRDGREVGLLGAGSGARVRLIVGNIWGSRLIAIRTPTSAKITILEEEPYEIARKAAFARLQERGGIFGAIR